MIKHISDNQLLAEFIGYTYTNELKQHMTYNKCDGSIYSEYPNTSLNVGDLKFNYSFDWLIPVIRKCVSLGIKDSRYSIQFTKGLLELNHQVIYESLTNFIKETQCEHL